MLGIITFISILNIFELNGYNSKASNTKNSKSIIYDISQWQGYLSNYKVKRLKREIPFVILRVQAGSAYNDRTFQHNKKMLENNHMPYGVYSFSMYTSPKDASKEAKNLYKKAPHAKFYVNDYEVNKIRHGSSKNAAKAWVQTLRNLVGKRKILLYGSAWIIFRDISKEMKLYDGYWIAAYQKHEPKTKHILWQFSSSFHSKSLKEYIDASIFKSKYINWFIN